MSIVNTRRLAATAVAAVASVAAVAGVVAPASATVYRNTIGVASCVNQPTAPQVCVTTPTVVVFTTTGLLRLRFTANADHCSDMIATPVVDGRRLRGVRLGPGETTPWYFARKLTDGKVTPGKVSIGVQATGVPGGCNRGWLQSWSGTLNVRTGTDAPIRFD
jgi:hypothetical protein